MYDLCLRFYKSSDYPFKIDDNYALTFLRNHIINPSGLSLILSDKERDIGCLVGLATNHPFCKLKTATELAWWVDPLFRTKGSLKLFEAFEYWAVYKMYCDMICVVSKDDARVEKFYKKKDYIPRELSWYKSTQNMDKTSWRS